MMPTSTSAAVIAANHRTTRATTRTDSARTPPARRIDPEPLVLAVECSGIRTYRHSISKARVLTPRVLPTALPGRIYLCLFLHSAQRRFAARAIRLRPAALIFRRFLGAAAIEVASSAPAADARGLPRRGEPRSERTWAICSSTRVRCASSPESAASRTVRSRT